MAELGWEIAFGSDISGQRQALVRRDLLSMFGLLHVSGRAVRVAWVGNDALEAWRSERLDTFRSGLEAMGVPPPQAAAPQGAAEEDARTLEVIHDSLGQR